MVDMTLVHRGEWVTIDGVGFSAIGRLALLTLLGRSAEQAGAELRFSEHVQSVAAFGGYDLVVAAFVDSVAQGCFAQFFSISDQHDDVSAGQHI
jgi:hypothetical protein